MTSRLVALCIDATDALVVARFWAEALGWDLTDTADGLTLVPTDGTRFGIRFLPAAAPKVGKNCIHLDLTSTSLEDQADVVQRLLAAGGRHVDVGQEPDAEHVVLADPEGNELCVIEPTNSFLAGCDRLGSITCDGSPAVGRFWRDVLGWPLVWDQDEETAVRAPDGIGPFVTWGPPVPPNPSGNRLRLEITPAPGDERTEVDRLLSLGATRAGGDGAAVILRDPDGNELRVVGAST